MISVTKVGDMAPMDLLKPNGIVQVAREGIPATGAVEECPVDAGDCRQRLADEGGYLL